MTLRRVLLTAAATLSAGLLALTILGATTAREHTVTVESSFAAPPATVFETVATPQGYPSWRTGVESLVRLPDHPSGAPRFVETAGGDELTFIVLTSTPPSRWVTRIDDPSLPFGGTWTHEFEPTPSGGTQLRSREDGTIDNLLVRGLARLFIDPRASLEAFHGDLRRHLPD